MEEIEEQFQLLQRRLDIFEERRRVTLTTIDEVVQKLDSTAVQATVVQGAGMAGSMLGSGLSLVAGVCSLLGLSGAATLLNFGAFLGQTGKVTAAAGKLTENGISVYYLNKVIKVLEADQEATTDIREWLTGSQTRLKELFKAIFGYDLDTNWRKTLKVYRALSVLTPLHTLPELGSATMNHCRDLFGDQTGEFARYIGEDSAQVLECLEGFCEQCVNLPSSIQFKGYVYDGLRCGVGLYGIYHHYDKMSGERASVSLPATSLVLQPRTDAVIKCCFLEAVNITASVLYLMSAKEVITTGKSRYSDALNELKSNLQQELLDLVALRANVLFNG